METHTPLPMQLNAMVVQKEQIIPCGRIEQDYSYLDIFPFGWGIENPPFSDADSLESGVHLHWILPESFTTGTEQPDGSIAYSTVPDHFLVTRIASQGDDKPCFRQWLVYSSAVSDHWVMGVRSGPIPDENGFHCAYLGKAVDYPSGSETVDFDLTRSCTAVMPGDPCFAAYYPGCRNIFGFYDDLDNIGENARLSYLVCGWTQDGVVCAGQVWGLTWGAKPQAAKMPNTLPQIAVAETSSEAMSAVYHSAVMQPLMDGMLGESNQPGAQREGEYKLHRQGFSAHSGGELYRLDGGTSQMSAQEAELLCKLNRLSEREKQISSICDGLRQRIYLYWYLETADTYTPYEVLESPWYEPLMKKEQKRLKRFSSHLEKLQTRIRDVKTQLQSCINGTDMKLKQIPAPRFWSPTDPVVLLKDTGRSSSPEMLQQRAAKQGLRLLATDEPLPEGVECPKQLIPFFPTLFQAVLDAHCQNLPCEQDPAPWSPIYLEWEVRFISCSAQNPMAPLTGWRLENLDWIPDSIGQTETFPLQGRTILSGHGPSILADALRRRADKSTYRNQLLETAEQAEAEDILSQQLSGFHQPFLAYEPGLILPPFDFGNQADYARQIAQIVGNCNTAAPAPTRPLRIVRAGGYRLVALRLVDSFGRKWDMSPAQQMVVPSRLRPSAQMQAQTGMQVLAPPRLVQPSRLRFSWYRVSDGQRMICPQKGESPVFGWLSPCLADHSLMVYGRDGKMVGILRTFVEGDCKTVVWEDAPGVVQSLLADQPDLCAFVQGIQNAGKGSSDPLQDILLCMNKTPGAGLNPQNPHLAMYEGRIFALAACGIRLESLGTPPVPMRQDDPQPPFSSRMYSVRVGDSAHPMDGVCGLYDLGAEGYGAFHSQYAPTESSYLRCGSDISVQYGLSFHRMAILFDPLCSIHIISGFLPVVSCQLDPETVQRIEKNIYAAMQVAPLLTKEPPEAPRLPLDGRSGLTFQWMEHSSSKEWYPRLTPENVSQNAWEDSGPRHVREGWLMLEPDSEASIES